MSLDNKVKMTKRRIQEWVDEFGLDGVYVSFSGGKDSTVLLHIAREMYGNDVKACFDNTGLEYPEIVQFVKTFDNVDIVRPKMNFKKVIEKYGYPFISKEVSECVYGARKYLTSVLQEMERPDRQTDRQPGLLMSGGQACIVDYVDLVSTKGHKLTGGGTTTSTASSGVSVPIPVGKTYSDRQVWEAVKRAEMSQTGGGGQVKSFSNLMGIRAIDNSIDSRLWQGYRQSTDTNPDGDIDNPRESNDGDYP